MTMIQIGNFFFKYRNWVFIPLYLALFIPSPVLLNKELHYWLIWTGLSITVAGQLIRCLTIGLAYIDRGGKDKKVHASRLVTEGIFNHCRNPLYVGNILKLLGLAILSNSLIYLTIFIPVFLLIYQAIVLAEENFLRNQFGVDYDNYCHRTHRWIIRFSGIKNTFRSMAFRWQRPVAKELAALYIWMSGIVLILLLKYPEITGDNTLLRNQLLTGILPTLLLIYLVMRYLKKSGRIQGL